MLYGGNAILYHVALSEYAELLQMLTDLAGENTLMIPSVGPAYGMMMDQAAILRADCCPPCCVTCCPLCELICAPCAKAPSQRAPSPGTPSPAAPDACSPAPKPGCCSR